MKPSAPGNSPRPASVAASPPAPESQEAPWSFSQAQTSLASATWFSPGSSKSLLLCPVLVLLDPCSSAAARMQDLAQAPSSALPLHTPGQECPVVAGHRRFRDSSENRAPSAGNVQAWTRWPTASGGRGATGPRPSALPSQAPPKNTPALLALPPELGGLCTHTPPGRRADSPPLLPACFSLWGSYLHRTGPLHPLPLPHYIPPVNSRFSSPPPPHHTHPHEIPPALALQLFRGPRRQLVWSS